jgi:alpha-galactosidase
VDVKSLGFSSGLSVRIFFVAVLGIASVPATPAQIFKPDTLFLELAFARRPEAPFMLVLPFGNSVRTHQLDLTFSRGGEAFFYYLSAADSLIVLRAEIRGRFKAIPGILLLANGFQSWSESRYLGPCDKQKPPSWLIRCFSRYYGDATFYNYRHWRGWQHSWSLTAAPLSGDSLELLASLNENTAYTCIRWHYPSGRFVIERDLRGKSLGSEPWPLFEVFHSIGRHDSVWNQWATLYDPVQPWQPADTLRGWTSWYYHYTRISETKLLENLRAFCKLPVQVIQLDDGYQQATGDWTRLNTKFPSGLKALADSIHQCGKKAGLWWAPFVVSQRSVVFREHPEWLLRHDNGSPLRVGFNPLWGGWYYALDFYQPPVRRYLESVLDMMLNVWSFDFIKADFLFAAGLLPRPHLNKTRAETMSEALAWLREKTQGRLLLLCGVPLGPAFKKTDYCRIGNDVHTGWDMTLLRWLRASERPSTRLSVQNTLTRHPLGGRVFQNDPDVYILRKKKQRLHFVQQEILARTNHGFGAVLFTSDNPAEYKNPLSTELFLKLLNNSPESVKALPHGKELWLIVPKSGKPELWDLRKGRFRSIPNLRRKP